MNNTEIVNAILAARNASTAAYEHVLEELLALDPSKLRPISVDAHHPDEQHCGRVTSMAGSD